MESYKVASVQDMKNVIATNPDVQKELKHDPEKAIQKFQTVEPLPDNWIYRIVVGSLGLVIVSIALGIVWRIASGGTVADTNVPTILTALSSAAVGALAGLLAPSPVRQS